MRMFLIVLGWACALASAVDYGKPIPPDDPMFIKDRKGLYVLAPMSSPEFDGTVPRENWSCLFTDGKKSAFRKTRLEFLRDTPRDNPPSEYILARDGKGLKPVFCLANYGNAPRVTTAYLTMEGSQAPAIFDTTLRIHGKDFRFRKTVDSLTALPVPMETLSMEAGDKTTKLDRAQYIGVVWIGDLNDDGQPDLFVASENKEVCSEHRFFLSKAGRDPGYLWLAGFYSCGY